MKLQIGDARGERVIELQRRVSTLGSSEDCQIQLCAPGVQEVHGVIYQDPEGYRLVPSHVHCLILVAHRPVQSHLLASGDQIQVGEARLHVLAPGASAAEEQRDPAKALTPPLSASPLLASPLSASPLSTSPLSTSPLSTHLAVKLLQQLETFSSTILEQAPWPRPAEVLLDSLLYITGAEHGFIVLMEKHPHIVAARPPVEDASKRSELLSDSILQEVMQSQKPLIISDAQGDPLFASAPSIIRLGLSSVMCMPLQVNSVLQGALYVGHRSRPDLFGPEALAMAHIFCGQAALLLQSARHVESLRHSVADLQHRLDLSAQEDLVAKSAQMTQVLHTLQRAAPSPITLLLLGETGTGKEVLARLIHKNSPRAAGPFIPINCAAIPNDLMESEFFGHRKGAFTGAHQDQQGLVEAAHGGTLFLDEIGEMSPLLQVKLLRMLQERTIRRVGDSHDRAVDIRIVAATNRNLESDVGFRRDLYYRLAELVVQVPPLRHREGDLELLVRLFLHRFCAEFHRPLLTLQEEAWRCVSEYDWPGNIRELQNRLHRAVLMAESDGIRPEDLGLEGGEATFQPLSTARDLFVADYVRRAIVRAGGDKTRAAQELGIGLRSLYRHLQLNGDAE